MLFALQDLTSLTNMLSLMYIYHISSSSIAIHFLTLASYSIFFKESFMQLFVLSEEVLLLLIA